MGRSMLTRSTGRGPHDPPVYRPLTVMELLQLAGVRQTTPGITCSRPGPARGSLGGLEEGRRPSLPSLLACALASPVSLSLPRLGL